MFLAYSLVCNFDHSFIIFYIVVAFSTGMSIFSCSILHVSSRNNINVISRIYMELSSHDHPLDVI